ncbi:hypothetical protein [Vibrio sp. HN007]|uniref:hypothetical protein n=1 Tax=Vibrio iocasae TaxID=3098914 RepID=UPI0035D476EE
MKKLHVLSLVTVITVTLVSGCNSTSSAGSASLNNKLSAETLALKIEAVPENLSNTYSRNLNFNRYTKVTTSNGGAIHIIAQDDLTDNQIVRARSILEHYLAPYPGSVYGADKTNVANKMAENGATLLLLNGSDDGSNPAAELDGQPLYQDEIQVEGGSWYINQNYDHRDASYEEILHLVHDYGIGIDKGGPEGALPAYQAEIRTAQANALANYIWGIGAENRGWLRELAEENSLSQEYLASVIDSYYGLWGAWEDDYERGMWGVYIAKTRSDIATKDVAGEALMKNKFFHPYLTYNARIDESFTGDFSLKFDSDKAYTHHSQYLKDITLTGSNPSGVVVNQYDNKITGNAAINKVIFSGRSSQYAIDTQNGATTTVLDLVEGRDGKNELSSIEQLVFTDTVVNL